MDRIFKYDKMKDISHFKILMITIQKFLIGNFGGISMWHVLSFLRPFHKAMGIAWTLMLIELIVELTSPILMAKIIDDGVIKHDLHTVVVWGAVLVGLSLVGFISGISNSFFSSYVSQGFGFEVRKKIYQKIQSLSYASLNQYPTSAIITRLTNDVTQIQNTVFMFLRIAMRAPLLIVFATIMSLFVHFRLALILLVTIPFLVFFLVFMMRKGVKFFQAVQKSLDRVNKVIRENLTNIRLVKAYHRENYEINRFKKINQQLRDETMNAFRFVELTAPVLLLIMNTSIVLILWFGSYEMVMGEIKPGEIVAIVNYATRITGALSMLTFIIMAISRAEASGGRIQEIFHLQEEAKGNETDFPTIEKGKIEFQHVYFNYPKDKNTVLHDLSFTIEKNQLVAVIGATGSGKTTLIQLIPRLFEANEGKIFIDDREIHEYSLTQLREKIGYVPQESFLFTGTIKENIAWGNQKATMEEIIEAAKHAQIHENIIHFPNQYDTVIGQKGVNLSGGQKQRIAIARALVRKPKILLLDDSTSALDPITERRLLQSIQELACTTIMITQKISSAMNADIILLLDEGRLIGIGDHKFLLKTNALYQKIFQSQYEKELSLNVPSSSPSSV